MPFLRTMRAIQSDGYRASGLGVLLGVGLLAGWGLWMTLARVPVRVETPAARIETSAAVHRVEAAVAGRVSAVHVGLGDAVELEDLLFELDVSAQEAARTEAEAHLSGLIAEEAPLIAETEALRSSLGHSKQAAKAGVEEARARATEADEAARHAKEEAEKLESLRDSGAITEAEYTEVLTRARQRLAAAEAARKSVRVSEWATRVQQGDRRVRLAELERELTVLRGDIAQTRASLGKLDVQIAQSKIRATVAGRIGEIADFQPGSVVESGEHLASIVPDAPLRVVAKFPAADAVGRVKTGQPGDLRLDAFPWGEYGKVPVEVTRVATEPREGQLRVECILHPSPTMAGNLEHGLTGRVEVETERVPPVTLVLRVLGKLVETDSLAPSPQPHPGIAAE
jgi:membrane fusion protein (multidrug efflux system)